MKIKLLIAFVLLALVSCSDDERYPETTVAVPTDPEEPVGIERKLDSISYTSYTDGTVASKGKFEFDDANRLILVDGYNLAGTPVRQRVFTYNESGQLQATDFRENGFRSETSYEYDNSGRIIKTSNAYAVAEAIFTNRIFTYEDDGSITVNQKVYENSLEEGGGEIILSEGQYKYYKDGTGNIYKQTDADGNVLAEAVYMNGNMVSYASGSTNVSYTFDETNLPKGQYHNLSKNTYGSLQNAMLIEGFSSVNLGINNYVISQVSTDTTTYAYEFDEAGYPIKIKYFKEGNENPFQTREIKYK